MMYENFPFRFDKMLGSLGEILSLNTTTHDKIERLLNYNHKTRLYFHARFNESLITAGLGASTFYGCLILMTAAAPVFVTAGLLIATGVSAIVTIGSLSTIFQTSSNSQALDSVVAREMLAILEHDPRAKPAMLLNLKKTFNAGAPRKVANFRSRLEAINQTHSAQHPRCRQPHIRE